MWLPRIGEFVRCSRTGEAGEVLRVGTDIYIVTDNRAIYITRQYFAKYFAPIVDVDEFHNTLYDTPSFNWNPIIMFLRLCSAKSEA